MIRGICLIWKSHCGNRWIFNPYSIIINIDVVRLRFRFFNHHITLNILIIFITAAVIQELLEFILIEIDAIHWNFWNRAYVRVIMSKVHLILLETWNRFILRRLCINHFMIYWLSGSNEILLSFYIFIRIVLVILISLFFFLFLAFLTRAIFFVLTLIIMHMINMLMRISMLTQKQFGNLNDINKISRRNIGLSISIWLKFQNNLHYLIISLC